MAEPSHTRIKVSELYQVGIAVYDLERSMEHYRNTLGTGSWEVFIADASSLTDMMYHGRPIQRSHRAAFTMVGPMQLELDQPLGQDNVFSDFLKEHGEGVHHLGHVRVDNIDEAVRTWENEGFRCLERGRFPGGGYAYMDTIKTLGVIVELLETHEGPSPLYPEPLWRTW
jgi:hypothetical protein